MKIMSSASATFAFVAVKIMKTAVAINVLAVSLLMWQSACLSQGPEFLLNKDSKPNIQCHLPVHYVIASDTPKQYHKPIRQGLNYWNKIINKNMFCEIKDVDIKIKDAWTGQFNVIGVNIDGKIPIKIDGNACAFVARVDDKEGCYDKNIVMMIHTPCLDMDSNFLESTIRHEAGHVLGLKDSYNPKHIMFGTNIESPFGIGHPKNANSDEIKIIKKVYNGY